MMNLKSCFCGLALLTMGLANSVNAQTTYNVSATSMGFATLEVPTAGTPGNSESYFVVLVSVTDEHGAPVYGLKTNNFQMLAVLRTPDATTRFFLKTTCKIADILASDSGAYLLKVVGQGDECTGNGLPNHQPKGLIRVVRVGIGGNLNNPSPTTQVLGQGLISPL